MNARAKINTIPSDIERCTLECSLIDMASLWITIIHWFENRIIEKQAKTGLNNQARDQKSIKKLHCLRQPGNHRLNKALDPMALRPRLSPGLPFRTELILAQKKAKVNNLIIFSNLCNRACTPQSSIFRRFSSPMW